MVIDRVSLAHIEGHFRIRKSTENRRHKSIHEQPKDHELNAIDEPVAVRKLQSKCTMSSRRPLSKVN